MKSLGELQNYFTKENYPPNENNISKVPFEDVQTELILRFQEVGFTYTVTHVGSLGNGNNYVVLSITLPLEKGLFTFPGAADGPIGIAGLITTAFVNGVLRHAGMGSGLYQHEEGQEPNFQNTNIPSNAAPVGAPPNPFSGQPYGNQYQGTGRKWNGKWDGNLRIKSGKFEGLTWAQVPPGDLARMASQGNDLALKETSRRTGN